MELTPELELTPEQIAFLKKAQEITEKFKADFKEKKIVYASLEPKHQERHDNVDKLDKFVKNLLSKASAKPQVNGVVLKEDIGKKEGNPSSKTTNKNVLQEDDGEMSIRKKKFIEIVQEKLDTLNATIAELGSKKNFTVSAEVFNQKLSSIKCFTPFGDEFKTHLQNLFEEFLNPTVQNIYDVFQSTIHYYEKAPILKTHYDNFILSYNRDEIIEKDLVNEMDLFDKFILESKDVPIINDPIYVKTTAEYNRNIDRKINIEKLLIKLKEDADSKTRVEYKDFNFVNNTKLDCAKIIHHLHSEFKTDKEEIRLLYDRIIKKFEYQVEIFCYDALNVITQTISTFIKDEAYIQLYIDKENFSPDFVSGGAIAKALVDSKLGSSGDAKADSLLQKHFEEWQKTSVASLKPLERDSQSLADLDFVHGYAENLSAKSLSIFKNFWESILGIVAPDNMDTDITDMKLRIKEKIMSTRHTDFYTADMTDSLMIPLPDIASLAAAVNDSRLDTSFQHYLSQWEAWSKSNLNPDLGIPDGTQFYAWRLQDNLKTLFKYQNAGNFFLNDIQEVFESYLNTLGDKENGLLESRFVKDAWRDLLERAAPTQKEFSGVGIVSKELYNHIVTYTKYLPSFTDIQMAIKDAQKTAKVSSGIKYRGSLAAKFVKYNWLAYGMIPMSRGFEFDVTAYLKKDNDFNYVSSISAKEISVHGLKMGDKKITFKPEKHTISNDTCTQIINIEIDVEDFGNESASSTGGGGLGFAEASTTYGEDAPIGKGVYKTKLVFRHIKQGDKETVDFDAEDTNLDNLPSLEFDNKKSSLLQTVSSK